MVDGLVDLVDGRLEAPGRQVIVLREGRLETVELVLEIGDVDVLGPHLGQFGLVLQRLHAGIAQQRDDGQEELRTHHIHLRKTMRDIDDAAVVELVLRLQQRHQHRVFALLLDAVLIQFLEEVFVLFLGRGLVVLVLHLEHDGDDLGIGLIAIAEDVVALAAAAGIVVLLEIRAREGHGADAVELDLAVLLQGLADHLGGQARLQVLETFDGIIAVLELGLVLVLQRLLGQALFQRGLGQSMPELVAFLLHAPEGLGNGQLLRQPTGLQFGPQGLDFGIAGGGALLQFVDQAGFGQLLAGLLVAPQLFQLVGQDIALPGHLAQRLVDGQLAFHLRRIDLRAQLLDLGILAGGSLVHLGHHPGLGQFDGGALVLLGQRQPLMQLLLELAIAYLLEDLGVTRFVDLECLAAMRTHDFVHAHLSFAQSGIRATGPARCRVQGACQISGGDAPAGQKKARPTSCGRAVTSLPRRTIKPAMSSRPPQPPLPALPSMLKMLEKSSLPAPFMLWISQRLRAAEPSGMAQLVASAFSTASPRSLSIRSTPKPPAQPLAAGAVSITPGQGLQTSSVQLRPELLDMISESTLGSMPLAMPRRIASEVPIIRIPSSMLLHTLTVWPLPLSPAWQMALPIFCRQGWAASKAAVLPPTMKVRVPAVAPLVPPETGASSISKPPALAAAATLRAASGAMVEQSISRVPGLAEASTPASPRQSDSTCRLAGSMVMTTSALATAAMESASVLPPTSTSLSTLALTRSWPLTANPALTRFCAIGKPMLPRPMKTMLALMMLSSLQGDGGVDLAGFFIRGVPARGDGLGLGPEGHGLLAVGAEVAQLGGARTGEAEIRHRHRDRHVDPDLADVDLVLELARRIAGAGEDGGAVAVGVGIDEGDGVIQGFQFDDAHGRAEDFLGVDIHLRLDAREDGRADEVAVLAAGHRAVAAIQQQLGALLHANADQAFHAGLGRCRDQRADIGLAVGTGTDLHGLGTLDDFRDPFTGLAHQHHHRIGHAALAGGTEGGSQQVVDGLVLGRIRQHDAVVLGAHHALGALAGFAGTTVDVGADMGGADEGDRLDIRMVADHVGHVRAAMHHVEHARRQAGLVGQLDQEQRRGRILLRGFQHEGIAAGHRDGEHEAGQHHREVEGGDARPHAQRLVEGVDVDATGHVLGQLAQLQRGDRAGVLHHFQAAHDFTFGVGQRLAVFTGNHFGQRGDVLAQQLLELQHDAHALRQRGIAPGLEGRLGVGDGAVDFFLGSKRHARHYFLGGRVEYVAPLLGGGLHLLAVDVQGNVGDVGLAHDAISIVWGWRSGWPGALLPA
eukprot:TRINITY_DN14066_c0_g1_i1.p1 TRINITY_DN14066_c0_g1~~TRINITY_DN14066_c0_g1_i1.p1  ORF type:complete len:1308 (-),score=476.92 TRINITY_DN14066_c0_g1_i1:655-4578(-)